MPVTKSTSDLFEYAIQHHKSGNLAEAERCYREILNNDPDHPDAVHMQLMISSQTGNMAQTQILIDKALVLEVPEPSYQSNLGIVLQTLNRTDEAIQCYQRATSLDPGFFEAHFNLGTLLQSMGKNREAIQCYRKTLELKADFTFALNNLGLLLAEAGNIDEAIALLQKAVILDSGFAAAFNNLSRAFFLNGNLEEAVRHCQAALRITPDFPEALNNLGIFLSALGELKTAEILFHKALNARDDFFEAYANFGKLLLSCGNMREALENFRTAAWLERDNPLYWQYVSDTFNLLPEITSDSQLESDLEQCLSFESIDTRGACKAATYILSSSNKIRPWLSMAIERKYNIIFDAIRSGELSSLLGNSLLLRLMNNSIVCSFYLEILLTLIRSCLLQMAVEDPLYLRKSKQIHPFLYALARQCFLNEYIYFQTQEESDWLTELADRSNHPDFLSNEDNWPLISILGSYIPLHRFDWSYQLIEMAQSATDTQFKSLIHYQVEEPWKEREIRVGIPRLIEITNPHTLLVQAQYDKHPYPRWQGVKHLPAIPFAALLKSICPGMQHVFLNLPKHPDILIAGCGSGQHAVQSAFIHRQADILAMDISLASLAYGLRMARRYNMAHIEFVQGDILDLARLDRQFHIIECVGVLHHLLDPWEGLRVLTEALHPEGIMLIGVYSEFARADLSAMQDWVHERGYGPNIRDIRRCRQEMIRRSTDARIKRCLEIRDFYSTSECRDLLFHVHEYSYTLPEIKTILSSLNLEFLGFQFENPSTLYNYRELFPQDSNAISLDYWHHYEKEHPNTFIAMYQFWVRKKAFAKSD